MKISDIIYLYDGTIEGLFTVLFDCCQKKEKPKWIGTEEDYESNLLDTPIYVETNLKKSEYIFRRVSSISDYVLYTTYTAFLSENSNKGTIIVNYLISAFLKGKNIGFMRNIPEVVVIMDLCKKVKQEGHRLKGFLRFRELYNNILYAEMEPDNNIIEYLANHFKERFKNEKWIINDKKRNILVYYDGYKCIFGDSSEFNFNQIDLHANEEDFKLMWHDYFNTIAIKERTNRRCQLNFMPLKYWKYMSETKKE